MIFMRYSDSAIRLDSIGVLRGYVRECAQPADSGSPTCHATGLDTDPQHVSCIRFICSSYVPVSAPGDAAATPAIPPKPARQTANPQAPTNVLIAFMAFP